MYLWLCIGYLWNFDVLFFIYWYMYIVLYLVGINVYIIEGIWYCILLYGFSVLFLYGVVCNIIFCRIIENEYIFFFWVFLGGMYISWRSFGVI